jgi:hypothetical protein
VGIGGRETDSERDAVPIHHNVVLGAALAPVRRVRTGRFTPFSPARSNCSRSPTTRRWWLRHRASSGVAHGAAARRRLPANRAGAANTSCCCRSRVRSAISARGSQCAARR